MIVFDERHLKRILTIYFDYYHRWRTHLGLEMDTPQGRDVQTPDQGKVTEFPDLGGLHHHYLRLAAWDPDVKINARFTHMSIREPQP